MLQTSVAKFQDTKRDDSVRSVMQVQEGQWSTQLQVCGKELSVRGTRCNEIFPPSGCHSAMYCQAVFFWLPLDIVANWQTSVNAEYREYGWAGLLRCTEGRASGAASDLPICDPPTWVIPQNDDTGCSAFNTSSLARLQQYRPDHGVILKGEIIRFSNREAMEP